MGKIFYSKDHLMILSNYEKPKLHKHFAKHILISPHGEIECSIEGKSVLTRGIIIQSGILHSAEITEGGIITVLLDETSKRSKEIDEKYLESSNYHIIDDKTLEGIINIYEEVGEYVRTSTEIFEALKIKGAEYAQYDNRVEKVLHYIDTVETLDSETYGMICKEANLSLSRISHIFSAEVGIPLRSYIRFMKVKKTHENIMRGYSLTDAAIQAGFDSSSHFSNTCRDMFGLSYKKFLK